MEDDSISACPSTKDVVWLAGLLEGEGYFGIDKGYPEIILAMCDEDIVKKVQFLLSSTQHNKIKRSEKNPKWKDCYRTSTKGRNATSWMMMIYQFMGNRRQGKIKSILMEWKNTYKIPLAENENCKKGLKIARHNRWHVNRSMPNHECHFCIELYGYIEPPVKPLKEDRRHSDEFRKRMSELKSGEQNHNWGKPRSAETRRKIAISNTGKKHSQETIQKLSDAHKKNWADGVYKKRDISGTKNPNYRKSRSFDVRQKISESNKRAWVKRKEKALANGNQ